LKTGLILTYQNIFPGQEVPDPIEILKQAPTLEVLDCFCFINAQLHLNPYDTNFHKWMVDYLLNLQPRDFKIKVEKGMQDLFGINKENVIVFDIHCTLNNINRLLTHKKFYTSGKILSIKEKKVILLASLAANNYLNKPITIPENLTDPLDIACAFLWPNLINSGEHRIQTNFMVQAFKSLDFIDYISNNHELAKHFCNYFEIDNSNKLPEFCKNILYTYVLHGINKTTERMNHGLNGNLKNPVLEKFCLNINSLNINLDNEEDFNTLRTFPIIKINNEVYKISNWNFILNKLGTGLLFDLYYRTDLKNQYEKDASENIDSNFGNFKTDISKNYSEKFFQRIFLEVITNNNDFRKIAEDESDKKNQDFYVRRENKIILIEFKDALMRKYNSYEEIKIQINNKINNKKKGTGQLKKLFDKLDKNINHFEADGINLDSNEIIIYPMIIVTEPLFTISGITQHMNKTLKELIGATKYSFTIKPLILVEFDFFLLTHDMFKFKKIDLFKCIELYYSRVEETNKDAEFPTDINRSYPQYFNFSQHLRDLIPSHPDKVEFETIGTLANIVSTKLKLGKR